jgi:HK97 family phage portal protein
MSLVKSLITGLGWRKQPEPKAKKKTVSGASATVADLFKTDTGLSNYQSVSDRLLKANEGWVFKNNDLIAKEAGNIEFELFSIKRVGQEIQFDPIVQHPLLEALDRFNEFTAASSGFYLTESHQNLAGDAFWYIDGRGPVINGIYLLQPDKVKVKLGEPTYGQRIIQAYEFKDNVGGKSVDETYDADEVVHFKNPNPNNPYRGKSKVEAVADDIDTDNLATLASKRLYQRGLIINFALSTSGHLTPEQRKQIRAELNSNHKGANHAYNAMILSGGLEPKSIQLTSREMETIKQQEWLRDKICAIFGNPKSLITTDEVNKANAEATILNWKRTTIKSEYKSITDTINEFLLPRFGDNLLLGFKDPVPEDRDGKIEQNVNLVNAKIITQNEAREDLGYEPISDEGADVLNQPMPTFDPSTQDEDAIPKSIKNISYHKFLRRSGIYKEIRKYKELKEASRGVAERLIKSRRKKESKPEVREHESFTNEQVWKFHNKQIKIVEAHEDIFRDKVQLFIMSLLEKALEQLPEEVARMQKKALFNEEDEIVRATLDFTPILNEVAIMAGQEALRMVDDDLVYDPARLRKTVERNVKKFAESMIKTDRDKIIDTIAQGVAEGKSVPVIRNELLQEFEETYTRNQAERITRTEVLRASNEGTIDAWKESEVVVGKQWLTAEDDRVDGDCEEMNGKIVDLETSYNSTIKDTFDEDTAEKLLDYGAVEEPPLHPNCRCTLLPVLVDSKGFDTKSYLDKLTQDTRIKELESQIDKRTKEFKELKEKNLSQESYIKELEEFLDE